MSGEVIIVEGNLGWANATAGHLVHSLDTYGPGGRWHRETRGKGTEGQRLGDALVDAGAHEGARYVVVAVNRFGTYEEVREAVLAAIHPFQVCDECGDTTQ